MKVLWITNTMFPEVCTALEMPIPVIGGWMYSSAMAIIDLNPEIELAVATTYSGDDFQQHHLNGITYYLLPENGTRNSYNTSFEPYWKRINLEFTPSVIHVHGTEYSHGLAYIHACGKKGVVVSVQGLVSIYSRFYFGGIDKYVLAKYTTFRDVVRWDSIFRQRNDFKKRGMLEMDYISLVNDVIGRTSWDKVHVKSISPTVNYHFCNETLRQSFYQFTWTHENCEKHRIFLSQGHYPIKGLHQVLKALPLILKRFPNVKVYVGGNDIINGRRWRISGYGRYILKLLKANDLLNVVTFTGLLSEELMVQEYLKANVFVCPSSIENSANSIGEAQLLGVPCVASFVGGTPDLIIHGETGLLYRFEEHEMMAEYICNIFENPILREFISESGKRAAMIRHNKMHNSNVTNKIYNLICNY